MTDNTIEEILLNMEWCHAVKTESLKEATQAIKELIDQREIEILDALYWMYVQYCGNGHDFMNAGENASELLEKAGYIKVDGVGRVLVDNGDSQEQKLKELEK